MASVQEPTTGSYPVPYKSSLSLKISFNIILQSTPSSPGRSNNFTNKEYVFVLQYEDKTANRSRDCGQDVFFYDTVMMVAEATEKLC
jgi:hypothetical protein